MDDEELKRRMKETQSAGYPFSAAKATIHELNNAFGGQLLELEKQLQNANETIFNVAITYPNNGHLTTEEQMNKKIEEYKNKESPILITKGTNRSGFLLSAWEYIDPAAHNQESPFFQGREEYNPDIKLGQRLNNPEWRIGGALLCVDHAAGDIQRALEAPYNQGKKGLGELRGVLNFLIGNPRINGDKGIKGTFETALAHVQGKEQEPYVG